MQGTHGYHRNRKGHGHGASRHKHASGNALVLWHIACMHWKWRPEPIKEEKIKKEWKRIKNERNRRKQ
jgi:hypothetical protein